MKWEKAPEELKATIGALMKDIDCRKRLMFGYPAYFINAYMFAGLFGDKLFLRLSSDQKASLEAEHGTLPYLAPLPGRLMKDYVVLPKSLYENQNLIARVLAEAATHCRRLPPKKQNPQKTNSR